MHTFEEIYNYISKDTDNWSYYANPQCFIQDTWKDDSKASDFIKSYFKVAGKGRVVRNNILSDFKKYATERPKHSISTFLLCLYLSDMIDIILPNYIGEGFNKKYFLFLICLYHDIGYVLENKCSSNNLNTLKEDGFEAVQEIYNLQYIQNREFITYTHDELDIYFKEKIAETNPYFGGKPDHGILGGLMLYDRLRKQFEYSWKHKTRWPQGRCSFYYTNSDGRELHLSNTHYEAYALCADAIIAHNIFVNTLSRYLNKLGKQTHTNLINSSVNPFLYLLSLADTLEPIKRGINLNEISIEKNKKTFTIHLEDNIETSIRDKYFNAISDLDSWMDVSAHVDIISNNVSLTLR